MSVVVNYKRKTKQHFSRIQETKKINGIFHPTKLILISLICKSLVITIPQNKNKIPASTNGVRNHLLPLSFPRSIQIRPKEIKPACHCFNLFIMMAFRRGDNIYFFRQLRLFSRSNSTAEGM